MEVQQPQQQLEQQDKEKEQEEQQQQQQQPQQEPQQQQQQQPESPDLQTINISPDDISDFVPVDMIFLRLRPETNHINESHLSLPLSSIKRLHENRIERYNFTRHGDPADKDITLLRNLCKLKGLPVFPVYPRPSANEGEPAAGDPETLRAFLLAQLRRVQDQERWEPRPIHIRAYLRYFREGDGEDAATERFQAEVERQLRKERGAWEDISDPDRRYERWVSDGPPGTMINWRKWGWQEDEEGIECNAPGTWDTMYWIQGGLAKDSRYRVEKKRARDSGYGMGENEEMEDEAARQEEIRKRKEKAQHRREENEARVIEVRRARREEIRKRKQGAEKRRKEEIGKGKRPAPNEENGEGPEKKKPKLGDGEAHTETKDEKEAREKKNKLDEIIQQMDKNAAAGKPIVEEVVDKPEKEADVPEDDGLWVPSDHSSSREDQDFEE